MDTQTQIDRLIELAIVQRTDLKKLVSELPQLREHLSAEIERTFDEFEPQLRTELEEFCATRADDKHAKLSAELSAKIESFSRSLQDSAQAKFSALLREREENVRVAKEAEDKIAEHAASLPSAVKEIVEAELSRFPRAGEIDQLRKEFQEPRGLNPRGKWTAGEVYNKLDLVAYNGDSFVSNTNGNRERPNRSSDAWTLNAARGNAGGGGGISSLTDILPIPSSGQILGSEGPNYTPKTLVAGANITITETPTQITITGDEGQIELQDGTAAAPSLFFANDVDTGLFRPGTNLLGIAAGGQAAITIGATEMTLNVTDVKLGGDLSIDNDTLYIDKANSRVGIGTSTPNASLVVRSQGSTNTRSVLVEHVDNTTAFSQAKFIGARSRGSHGSPSAVLANDSLASFNGQGYKTSAWSNTVGGFYVYAAENWTNAATGSFAAFRLAATGGTTVSEVARLTSTGNFLVGGTSDILGGGGLKVFGTTASTSTTTGALQVAGGVGVAGALFTGGKVTAGGGSGATIDSINLINDVGAPGTAQHFLRAGTTATTIWRFIRGNGAAGFQANGMNVDAFGGFQVRANQLGGSGEKISFQGAVTEFTNTTASTSTTTGALTVAGGVGVAGAGYFGASTFVTPPVATNTAFFVAQNTGGSLFAGIDNSTGSNFAQGNYAGLLWYTGNNKIVIGTNNTARLTVAANGNLLLGTTTDSANGRLQLATHTTSAGGIGFGTDFSLYRFSGNTLAIKPQSGAKEIFLYGDTGNAGLFDTANAGANHGAIYFNSTTKVAVIATNGTTALTLDSSQNATFAGKLAVSGSTSAASGAIGITSSDPSIRLKATGSVVADGNTFEIRNIGTSGTNFIQFRTVNDANSVFTTRMALWNNGGFYLGTDPVGAGNPGAGNMLISGSIKTSAPTGGAGAWELGVANTVTPTAPDRTITIEIGGTVYYLHAKTTND